MLRITSPSGRTIPLYQEGDLVPYRLPCGRIVRLAYWACRQQFEVSYQLVDGRLVTAVRADEAA